MGPKTHTSTQSITTNVLYLLLQARGKMDFLTELRTLMMTKLESKLPKLFWLEERLEDLLN